MTDKVYMEEFYYAPILNHRYDQWFQEVQYNGRTLNATERAKFISVADETIAGYAKGLPIIAHNLEQIEKKHDEYHEMYRTLLSVMRFVLLTLIDNVVISKYFILADKDYDRRFMRGKMAVILNEGFKKLYGFNEKTRKASEWNKLVEIMEYFPKDIHQQYQHLSSLLEEQSKSSSWWKDERNVETHLDAEKLYASRCENVIESKVMMDSIKLFNVLFAVDGFLTNMHACVNNYLLDLYRQGLLKEE